MANSSPEYTITKPGMNFHARKRDKPLRTYGRRSASTPEARSDAPPAKKRRLDSERPQAETATQESKGPETSSVPERTVDGKRPGLEPSTTTPVPVPAKRTSILSYFKPIPSVPVAEPPSAHDEAPEDEIPATTFSPHTASRTKRRARVLRLRAAPVRPAIQALSETSGDGDNRYTLRKKEEEQKEEEGKEIDPSTVGEHDVPRDPLRDRGDHLHNEGRGEPKVRPQQTRASRAVQTTLNISSQAAFAECKACDTVWNPLFPDDVKYHARRHANVISARNKGAKEED